MGWETVAMKGDKGMRYEGRRVLVAQAPTMLKAIYAALPASVVERYGTAIKAGLAEGLDAAASGLDEEKGDAHGD